MTAAILKRAQSVMRLLLLINLLAIPPILQVWRNPVDIGIDILEEVEQGATERQWEAIRSHSYPGFDTIIEYLTKLRDGHFASGSNYSKKLASRLIVERLQDLCDRMESVRDSNFIALRLSPKMETLRRLSLRTYNSTEATLEQLEQASEKNFHISSISYTANAELGIGLIAVTSFIILLYLYTLVHAANVSMRTNSELGIVDWVFAYPSRLSVVVGVLWILSPLFVFCFAWMRGLVLNEIAPPVIVIFSIVYVVLFVAMLEVRRAVLKKSQIGVRCESNGEE